MLYLRPLYLIYFIPSHLYLLILFPCFANHPPPRPSFSDSIFETQFRHDKSFVNPFSSSILFQNLNAQHEPFIGQPLPTSPPYLSHPLPVHHALSGSARLHIALHTSFSSLPARYTFFPLQDPALPFLLQETSLIPPQNCVIAGA